MRRSASSRGEAGIAIDWIDSADRAAARRDRTRCAASSPRSGFPPRTQADSRESRARLREASGALRSLHHRDGRQADSACDPVADKDDAGRVALEDGETKPVTVPCSARRDGRAADPRRPAIIVCASRTARSRSRSRRRAASRLRTSRRARDCGDSRCSSTACAAPAMAASATPARSATRRRARHAKARTRSRSARRTACSPPIPAITAPIRRRAGCFSIRCYADPALVFGAARRGRAAHDRTRRTHGALIDWPAAAARQVRPAAPPVRGLCVANRRRPRWRRISRVRARRRRAAARACAVRGAASALVRLHRTEMALARLARGLARRRQRPAAARFAAAESQRESSSTCSCSGSPRAASRPSKQDARDAGMRIGLIADLAVGMNPRRQPCMVAPAGPAARPEDRRAARSVQHPRPGLGPDDVLAARSAGERVRAVHRDPARRACGTPAACASTTPWG